LFKAAAAAFQDASATPATRDQVFAVITDGLRPRPRGLVEAQAAGEARRDDAHRERPARGEGLDRLRLKDVLPVL
jgi:hypothetical protein